MPARLMPGLERRLKAEAVGDVRFDAFTRGRYATDASHYQMMPLGVVTPQTSAQAERAIAICRAEGVPMTARGGGTSQAGQTVNESIIVVELSLVEGGTKIKLEQHQKLRGYSRTGGFLLRRATAKKLDEALDGLARILG